MDYFEKMFGIAPDGGSGLLELIVALGAAALVFARARPRRQPRRVPAE
ncbi:MAG: hypothetical protein U0Q12_02965 [Vicinamibacterales bacterium]